MPPLGKGYVALIVTRAPRGAAPSRLRLRGQADLQVQRTLPVRETYCLP